jgi:acetate kinase
MVDGQNNSNNPVRASNHIEAANIMIDWLKQQSDSKDISVIGHRIVHGGPNYFESVFIDDAVKANLKDLIPFDPEHLPVELSLIEKFQKEFANARQVACFDTAFHHNLPSVARLLPLPRHYEAKGIRRYGFHGLSYSYVLGEVGKLDGSDFSSSKVIIAHLGSGVSVVAIKDGKSIDTTMSLTPNSGVPMSKRSGDLDPGLFSYLTETENLSTQEFDNLVNYKSGLLGLSEISADMKELLDKETKDSRAKETVDLFCYQVKKAIGSLVSALGGVDTIVFTGGMGENAPKIRARICEGLDFLGVQLDTSANESNSILISPATNKVKVRVIKTNESATIVKEVLLLVSRDKSI